MSINDLFLRIKYFKTINRWKTRYFYILKENNSDEQNFINLFNQLDEVKQQIQDISFLIEQKYNLNIEVHLIKLGILMQQMMYQENINSSYINDQNNSNQDWVLNYVFNIKTNQFYYAYKSQFKAMKEKQAFLIKQSILQAYNELSNNGKNCVVFDGKPTEYYSLLSSQFNIDNESIKLIKYIFDYWKLCPFDVLFEIKSALGNVHSVNTNEMLSNKYYLPNISNFIETFSVFIRDPYIIHKKMSFEIYVNFSIEKHSRYVNLNPIYLFKESCKFFWSDYYIINSMKIELSVFKNIMDKEFEKANNKAPAYSIMMKILKKRWLEEIIKIDDFLK